MTDQKFLIWGQTHTIKFLIETHTIKFLIVSLASGLSYVNE